MKIPAELISDFLIPSAIGLVTYISAEIRVRFASRKNRKEMSRTIADEKAYIKWCDNVKRDVYERYNHLKSSMYDMVHDAFEGAETDIVRKHYSIEVPKIARCQELREVIRTVFEDARSSAVKSILDEPIASCTTDELDEIVHIITMSSRLNIMNNMIRFAGNSPVVDNIFQKFTYGMMRETISESVAHAKRTYGR